MKVEVIYFAILREQRGTHEEVIETAAETAAELYSELRTRHRFTVDPKWIRAAVNDEFAAMDFALTEGDRVIFLPPVAGG